jgi:hypothetical protein
MDSQSQIAPTPDQGAADQPPSVPDAFEVCDRTSANWLVRRINEARAYADHVKAWAALELRRAEREERFFIERYGGQLENWARAEISRLRRKSLKLPAGTIGFRKEPPRLMVSDESKLIAWCRRNLAAAIRVQTSVLKSLVRDHVAQTGESPDGAEISGGGERFYVR